MADRRHDALNAMLDRAVALGANPDPPAELEERIVAKLAQRKAKSRRRIRVACLAVAGMLLGIAVLKPVDSSQSEMPLLEPVAVAPSEIPVPQIEPGSPEVTTAIFDAEPPVQDVEEEPLISDLEIEPLNIAVLEVPALEHQ
jgi:hypothetical protein